MDGLAESIRNITGLLDKDRMKELGALFISSGGDLSTDGLRSFMEKKGLSSDQMAAVILVTAIFKRYIRGREAILN